MSSKGRTIVDSRLVVVRLYAYARARGRDMLNHVLLPGREAREAPGACCGERARGGLRIVQLFWCTRVRAVLAQPHGGSV